MEWEIVYILASVVLVSLISFVGVLALSLRRELLNKVLFVLIAFAAGTLLGGALFDLVPEAIELGGEPALAYIAGGIVLFFLLEKIIHLRHHHHIIEHDHEHGEEGKKKPFAYLNLVGEGIHNFLDGTIIAASYLISIELGVIATIAVILHEIPQELGDFAILVQGGFKPRKALLYNFLIALTAILGAGVMIFAASVVPGLTVIMLSIAGGGFLYIALGNLIPELHHETRPGKVLLQLVFLVLGIVLLYYVGMLFHAH